MRMRISLAVVLVLGAVLSSGAPAGAASCSRVDLASSPEKLVLLTNLAAAFNRAERDAGKDCVEVHVSRVSSGAGATLLVDDWPDPKTNGPRPVIWSPASSAWRAVVEQRRAAAGKGPIVPNEGKPFMLTPLVIAMPRPMAEALGWPATPIGFADVLALARDPAGWASKGHPEWGPFRLGKTNPNFSTSALSAIVAQYYAATGKTRDLSLEDLTRPDVTAFAAGVESAVVHYGDTTLTFLNNLYRADQRGDPFGYASAVAVEEKSVLDYNAGNPDGILDPGEKPRKPRVPLVAVYPKEGTLFSDNPLIVLDAPWVSKTEAAGAKRFQEFVTQPANQRKVLQFGFRPGNPSVALGSPITSANGVDPKQPQTTLAVPSPRVLAAVIDEWNKVRKRARVLVVIDTSGSMGDVADDKTGATKLDLVKSAATAAFRSFIAEDVVGLRTFPSPSASNGSRDIVPLGPVGTNLATLQTNVSRLVPAGGTPLYSVARSSYDAMLAGFDPSRINAVLLLTDGLNTDTTNNDLGPLLDYLRSFNEGETTKPVRIFSIAYGKDADVTTLRRISEATNGAFYSAVDPTTIANVFNAVISNF